KGKVQERAIGGVEGGGESGASRAERRHGGDGGSGKAREDGHGPIMRRAVWGSGKGGEKGECSGNIVGSDLEIGVFVSGPRHWLLRAAVPVAGVSGFKRGGGGCGLGGVGRRL